MEMIKQEVRIGQIWKSNYANITYKVLGGGFFDKIEMYNIENPLEYYYNYKTNIDEPNY